MEHILPGFIKLFYIPIALSCYFRGKRGITAAAFFAALLMLDSMLPVSFSLPVTGNIIYAMMFIAVSSMVVSLMRYSTVVNSYTAALIGNDKGIFAGAVETLQDIPKENALVKKLINGKECCRNLIESLPYAAIVHDGKKVLFVNRAAVETGGFSHSSELIGLPVTELIHSDYHDFATERIARILEHGGKAAVSEEKIKMSDGSLLYAEISASRIEFEGQAAVLAIANDISQRKKIENELKKSEERYRRLIEFSPYAVFVHNGIRFLYVNQAAIELLGLNDADYKDTIPMDFVHPDYKELSRKRIEKMIATRANLSSAEQKLITWNGSVIDVKTVSTAIPIDDDTGILSIVFDITERKRMEQELKRQKAYFEQLFQNSPQGIVMIDKNNRIIKANKGFEELFGYTFNEMFGLNLDNLVVPCSLTLEGKNITRKSLNGEIVELETVRKRKDDALVEVSVLSYPIVLDGKQAGAYFIYTDIRKRKEAERNLQESEERYRKLVELSPDSIFLLHNENFEYVNSSGVRLLGANGADQLLGKSILEFFHPDYVETFKDRISQIQSHGHIVPTMEEKLIRIDGTTVDVETVAASVFHKGSNYLLAYIRDISDRKRIADLEKDVYEKEQMLREAEEYERIRSEFFTNLSHEFRTPIHIVFASIQVLEMYLRDGLPSCNTDGFRKQIRIMKQNIFRLIRLINNLIDITKIEAQYFELCLANCDIVRVVEDIALSAAEYTRSKGIELIFDTNVEEKTIACDPDKIERIILNLLSNAIKFTGRGGKIWVDINCIQDYILISVKDNGIGIPHDKIDIIFERFRQVDQSLSRHHEGSGIGLSLVKSLVEMHDGRVWVESDYGKGTKFVIKLPANLTADKGELYWFVENGKETKTEKINIELSDIYPSEE